MCKTFCICFCFMLHVSKPHWQRATKFGVITNYHYRSLRGEWKDLAPMRDHIFSNVILNRDRPIVCGSVFVLSRNLLLLFFFSLLLLLLLFVSWPNTPVLMIQCLFRGIAISLALLSSLQLGRKIVILLSSIPGYTLWSLEHYSDDWLTTLQQPVRYCKHAIYDEQSQSVVVNEIVAIEEER